MSNPVSEDELKTHQENVEGKRVTLDALKNNIKKIDFYVHSDSQLTICIITLVNDFTVTGESACADPVMFDADIGQRIAQDNAEKKIWPLMGYALKQELYLQAQRGDGDTFLDRMKNEASNLEDNIMKLMAFIKGGVHFNDLHIDQQHLLRQQADVMTAYLGILNQRIETNIQ
jgi:hypothetical protein